MTQPRTRAPWLWWSPERGETQEDACEHEDLAEREPAFVAYDIAKEDWSYQSPDYWEELTIMLLPPGAAKPLCFSILTEARPHFYVHSRPT